MSESFVWTTDILSSSVWGCYSDSMTQGHFSGCCFVIMCSCRLLSQYLTVYLYDVSCCECDRILWYVSQVLRRLRSLTWGLWREPKVVWCGPNVVFWGLVPPPFSSLSPTPCTCPSKFLLWLKKGKKKKGKWDVSKTVSGAGGVRAICEEQQNKKVIYPFHNKYLLRHNTVTLVLFFFFLM